MKYLKTLLGVLFACSLFTVTALGQTTNAPSTDGVLASPASGLGDWTLSLSGNGSVPTKGDAPDVFGGQIAIGHLGQLVLPIEVGVRQSAAYSSGDAGTLLSTKPFIDWTLLKFGSLEFDLGGNFGVTYGNTPLTWTAAPEGVVRLYLKRDVDLFGRLEYPFALNSNNAPVAQDALVYTIGIRFNF